MAKIDPDASSKIDNYNNSAEAWAQPICNGLRQLIHETDNRIQEDWKWRAPVYDFKGMLCWVVPFKTHVGMNFYKGSLIEDTHEIFDPVGADGKSNRIVKIRSVEEFEANRDAIRQLVSDAIALNRKGIVPAPVQPKLEVPAYLRKALSKQKKAKIFFEGLAYSYKRDYIEWLTGAQREATRTSRLEKALNMLNRGEKMHDKYRVKKAR